jgi:hypothetical protein
MFGVGLAEWSEGESEEWEADLQGPAQIPGGCSGNRNNLHESAQKSDPHWIIQDNLEEDPQ